MTQLALYYYSSSLLNFYLLPSITQTTAHCFIQHSLQPLSQECFSEKLPVYTSFILIISTPLAGSSISFGLYSSIQIAFVIQGTIFKLHHCLIFSSIGLDDLQDTFSFLGFSDTMFPGFSFTFFDCSFSNSNKVTPLFLSKLNAQIPMELALGTHLISQVPSHLHTHARTHTQGFNTTYMMMIANFFNQGSLQSLKLTHSTVYLESQSRLNYRPSKMIVI